MAAPQINSLPPAPETSDSGEVFESKAFTFVGALEPFRQQANDQADWTNTTALAVASDASAASQSAADAADSAEAAEGAARTYPDAAQGLAATTDGEYFTVPSPASTGYLDLYKNDAGSAVLQRTSASNAVVTQAESARDAAQAAANFVGLWSDQTGSATVPTTVLHNDQYWQLTVDIADIAASEPSTANTDWDNIGNTLSQAPEMLDGLRRSVEAASGGRMTVFYTDKGQPSYFVRQGQFLCEDIEPGGSLGTGVHEAFKFGAETDAEIWIGAYAAKIIDGEAVSQPGLDPEINVDFDAARAACQAAGAGFDLMTIWDWAAISLWCMIHGFEPRGNTNHGRHHDNRWETGTRQDGATYPPGDSSGRGAILTGSGPAEWRHDKTMAGIADMIGNVWEWLNGMKIIDGRVHLSSDNSIPAESSYADTGFDIASATPWSSLDTTGAPESLMRSTVVPKGVDDPLGRLYVNTSGERLPFRGGNRSIADDAGLGALNLSYGRTASASNIGFRPRFRNP